MPNIKFLKGWMGYMSWGTPCTLLIAVIDYSNVAMPFAVTAFSAL